MGEILLWVKTTSFWSIPTDLKFEILNLLCIQCYTCNWLFFVYNRQLREAFNSMNTSNDGRLSLSDVSKLFSENLFEKPKTEKLSQLEMLFIIMKILKDWLWSSVGMVFYNIPFLHRFAWPTVAVWVTTWTWTGSGSVATGMTMPPTASRNSAASSPSTTPRKSQSGRGS